MKYNDSLDLINEKRKVASIVDRNLYILEKEHSFLLELSEDKIKGEFYSYINKGKIYVDIKNTNDVRFENKYSVTIDTSSMNSNSDLINIIMKSDKMEVHARKVLLKHRILGK